MSRPTLREALRQLEGRGLVAADRRRGLRVAGLSDGELRDALRTRAVLEGLSAETAAERAANGRLAPIAFRELRDIADAADTATRSGNLGRATAENRAFHTAITTLAANPVCIDVLERLWDRITVATARSLSPPDRVDVVDEEHHRIVDAVQEGDPEGAAAAARGHVLATLEVLT